MHVQQYGADIPEGPQGCGYNQAVTAKYNHLGKHNRLAQLEKLERRSMPWKRLAANRGGKALSAANGRLKNSDGLVLGRRTISPRLSNRA